jgi:hypothetical protein
MNTPAIRPDVSQRGALVQSPRAIWTTRIIGMAAAVGTALTVWLGLWVTPPDETSGNTVRGLPADQPATGAVPSSVGPASGGPVGPASGGPVGPASGGPVGTEVTV